MLGVRCFTLRDNTERPVTVSHGTNIVLGLDPDRIVEIPACLATLPPDADAAALGRARRRAGPPTRSSSALEHRVAASRRSERPAQVSSAAPAAPRPTE